MQDRQDSLSKYLPIDILVIMVGMKVRMCSVAMANLKTD